MQEISKPQFDALAGHVRVAGILALVQEAAWFATAEERLRSQA